MEGYLATVNIFAGDFAPKDWAFCHGQLLAISSNTALFSLLGTSFGGNGTTTFALPDLRGRVPVGTGKGPGLQDWQLGEMQGTTTNTMLISNLPSHDHSSLVDIKVPVNANGSDADSPEATFPAIPTNGQQYYANEPTPGAFMGQIHANGTLQPTGGSIPINNMQPYLAVNYIICQYGIYPSRG